jgi:hypothetical protein
MLVGEDSSRRKKLWVNAESSCGKAGSRMLIEQVEQVRLERRDLASFDLLILNSCRKLASDWMYHGVRQLQMPVTVGTRTFELFGTRLIWANLPRSSG